MSCRDWLFNPPIGVVLIVALALTGLALNNHQSKIAGGDKSPTEQLSDSQQGVTEAAIPPITLSETPPRKPNPERNEWREEEDLEAQKDMAKWAWWMMLAAFFSLGVTGVGVWFVKQTLDATRAAVLEAAKGTQTAQDAVEVTRRAYVIENRPWIAVRAVRAGKGHVSKESVFVTLWIRYTNIGKTPALHVSPEGQAYVRESDVKKNILHFIEQNTLRGQAEIGTTMLPNEWEEWGHIAMRHQKSLLTEEASIYKDYFILRIAVGCTYRSTFDDEIYHSARAYSVIVKKVTEGEITPDMVEFSELPGGHFT